jgi:branched-subunit amino acid transport protein
MSTELVGLAGLMALATYPWRAVALLAPGLDRLPETARLFTRLVAPAVLAALAAVATMVRTDGSGSASFHVGWEWLAVGLCIAIVAWRRNLLLGLVAAATLMAGLRAIGVAPIP